MHSLRLRSNCYSSCGKCNDNSSQVVGMLKHRRRAKDSPLSSGNSKNEVKIVLLFKLSVVEKRFVSSVWVKLSPHYKMQVHAFTARDFCYW